MIHLSLILAQLGTPSTFDTASGAGPRRMDTLPHFHSAYLPTYLLQFSVGVFLFFEEEEKGEKEEGVRERKGKRERERVSKARATRRKKERSKQASK